MPYACLELKFRVPGLGPLYRNGISRVHLRGTRSAENIAAVTDSVAEDSELLIRRRSQSLVLFHGSL